jgi:hypothetical protein
MSRRRWRAAEIGVLGERYAEDDLNRLAADLGRSPDSITSQARRLGLRSPQRFRRQTQARALGSKSVNVRFFAELDERVAYVLGYTWVRSRVKGNPPNILRLRCPAAMEKALLAVRDLLGSRHSVHRARGWTVSDVCNSWLVQTLIRRYGSPPSRDQPDPPLPYLPTPYQPHLARGLLVGAGSVKDNHITWTGTDRAMADLAELLQTATGISAPQRGRKGQRHCISWDNPHHVLTLSMWLRLNTPVPADEATTADPRSLAPAPDHLPAPTAAPGSVKA